MESTHNDKIAKAIEGSLPAGKLEDDKNVQVGKIKQRLNTPGNKADLSLEDLRQYVRVKYGSQGQFARKMGWSTVKASRLLSSDWVPQRPTVIERLAHELGMNIILLTRLFARLAEEPELKTADQLEIDDKE